jgi:MYXO-CTERM domain-containing protein
MQGDRAMKGFLRFLAGVFLLVAVIAAVNDVTRSLAADKAVMISTYEHWSKLAPVTFEAARGAIKRGTHPVVWEWGLAPLLQLPAWGLFGLLGLVCAWAGRRRREVNIFAN